MAARTTVIKRLALSVVLTYTVVHGNPAAGGNTCGRELQKQCFQEVDTLQSMEGKGSCRYLSPAIACISCKMQNCSDIGQSLLKQYSVAPYNCGIDSKDIVLTQGGAKAGQLCVDIVPTAQPSSSPSMSPTPEPSATPSEQQQGKQTQARNKGDTSGSSLVSVSSVWIAVGGMLVLMAQRR